MSDHRSTIERLVSTAGRTHSEQAGFALRDTPSALWQLAMLASLLAKPISADIAVDACRELRQAGARTPRGLLSLTWQQRVDALGRAHYKRYDESTATRLGEAAEHIGGTWRGDLRRLADAANEDSRRAAELLTSIPGIGPAGADIFLREAQRVWPWLQPHFDQRVLDGAAAAGLPHTRSGLARLLDGVDVAALAAALVRVTLDESLLD